MIKETTITLLNRIHSIVSHYVLFEKISGSGFNIFNVISMGASEVKLHSALIAELLNPNGKHAQGAAFLCLFINKLKEQDLPTAIQTQIGSILNNSPTVEPEKWTGNISTDCSTGGSIDILITGGTGDSIILENKIYATDQKGQLRRYHNFKKNAVLLYLTLDGKKATDETTLNDKYPDNKIIPISISYRHFVVDWLEDCKKLSVNHPILRETITQYIYLIKQLTQQSTMNTMQEEIVTYIAANPEFIESAENIWKNQGPIKEQIVRNLANILRGKAKEFGWHFETAEQSATLGRADSGFGFLIKNKPYWIYYYFRKDYETLEVGFDWRIDEERDEILIEKINYSLRDFHYGKRLNFDDWIWGSELMEWSETPWAEIQSDMPDIIIKTTRLFLDKASTFDF